METPGWETRNPDQKHSEGTTEKTEGTEKDKIQQSKGLVFFHFRTFRPFRGSFFLVCVPVSRLKASFEWRHDSEGE
jgi:hypothetical protein